ncbi:MAG: hypothetical protein JWN64_146 [Parcubacteria group bacterium]|nr:hypothetical protein [Parcubacteria group bacterium]
MLYVSSARPLHQHSQKEIFVKTSRGKLKYHSARRAFMAEFEFARKADFFLNVFDRLCNPHLDEATDLIIQDARSRPGRYLNPGFKKLLGLAMIRLQRRERAYRRKHFSSSLVSITTGLPCPSRDRIFVAAIHNSGKHLQLSRHLSHQGAFHFTLLPYRLFCGNGAWISSVALQVQHLGHLHGIEGGEATTVLTTRMGERFNLKLEPRDTYYLFDLGFKHDVYRYQRV